MNEADDVGRADYERGRSLLESGDVDGGIAALEASITAYPHFKALEVLGEALLKKGEPLRALVPLAAATTLNPQVRAASLLAEALLRLGQDLDAHRIARLALERDQGNRRARAVYDATVEAVRRWEGIKP
jgi:tetratricopeptide (TPR) repeat protein